MSTPLSFAITQFAHREGMRRSQKLSMRFLRQPLTMSYPSEIFSRNMGIAGAALDVYEKEPLPSDSPLRDPAIEDRCRLLPHFASAAKITRLSPDPNKGMAGRCVQGLIDVLEKNYGGDVKKMPYVVNKEAF